MADHIADYMRLSEGGQRYLLSLVGYNHEAAYALAGRISGCSGCLQVSVQRETARSYFHM